jgi:aldehyde dehydrogenase (NAD+)
VDTSYDRLFIGGRWQKPAGSGTIEVVNPTTEEVVGTVPDAVPADMDAAVAAARQAFDQGPWPRMTPAERGQVLAKVSEAITAEMQPMAELIATEMGSPVSWATLAQVMAPTMIFTYYAGLGTSFAFDRVQQGLLGQVLVRREPVGVVAAVTPWNVPLFLAAAKLAPALLAGCAVVFKPAPETPLDGLRLAQLFADAGLPEGVLSVVPAGRETGEHLVRHPGVDKVSFTGSTAAGRAIGAICGEQLKRCSLELGGKSAAVLLDDVDLDQALPMLLPNAIMNNGEACIAQTRILAPRSRYQEVVDALVEKVGAMKVGDALDPATEVGPLVAKRQLDRVEGYIRTGQEEGAKVAIGGGRPAGMDRGWFVEPTVFVDVDNSMRIAQEEIFGPVLAVIPYEGDDEALRIANDSEYGLCGSVWTADPDRGLEVA